MLRLFNLQLFAENAASLSVYDEYNLSDQDKKAMKDIRNRTIADPQNVTQYHQLAEDIRSKYNYSGGDDGNQYIKKTPASGGNVIQAPFQTVNPIAQNNMNVPQIPTVEEYSSNYDDMINSSLNKVINNQFSYNPDEDKSYQAFVKKATRLGDEAFANNIGALSSTTGGRLNSWAATAASTARNQFAMQAAEAVGEFEDRAYGRFVDQQNQSIDMIGLIMDLDERDYSRYRDKVNDTLTNYENELSQYKQSIDERKNRIDEASERTKTLGYVSNEDALLLGLPPGTLSYEASNKIADMNDWLMKQEKQIDYDQKQLDQEFEYEKKILELKAQYDTSSSRSSSGSRSDTNASTKVDTSYDGDPANDKRTKSEMTKRDSEIEDFEKYIQTDEFRRSTPNQKIQYFDDKIDQILDDNAHGLVADWVAEAILTKMTDSSAYKSAKKEQEKFQSMLPPSRTDRTDYSNWLDQ